MKTLKTLEHEPGRFGGCPECGDGKLLNIGRDHYLVCDAHRTAWNVGSNLFSSWREEDEEVWRANEELLRGYREVEPRLFRTELEERRHEQEMQQWREQEMQKSREAPTTAADPDLPFF